MAEVQNQPKKGLPSSVPKLIMPNTLIQASQPGTMYLNPVYLVTPTPMPGLTPIMQGKIAHIWPTSNIQQQIGGLTPIIPSITVQNIEVNSESSAQSTAIPSSTFTATVSTKNTRSKTVTAISPATPANHKSPGVRPILKRQLSDRDAAEILALDMSKPILKDTRSRHRKRQARGRGKKAAAEPFVPKKAKLAQQKTAGTTAKNKKKDMQEEEVVPAAAEEDKSEQDECREKDSKNVQLQLPTSTVPTNTGFSFGNMMSLINAPNQQAVMVSLPVFGSSPGVVILNQPPLAAQPIPILPKDPNVIPRASVTTATTSNLATKTVTKASPIGPKPTSPVFKGKNKLGALIMDVKKSLKRKPATKESSDSKPFRCHYCYETFKDESELQDHAQTHTKGYCYKCEICSQVFRSSLALQKHSEFHNDKTHDFKCSVCLRPFDDLEELERHTAMHMRKRPHRCTYCPKAFRDPGSLQKHVRVHTGEKPYSCQHCPKSFAEYSSLRKHLRTHTGEQPYKCEYCSKAFSISGNLQRHILIHTGQRPYQCKYCLKSFNNPSHLRRHVKNLHLKEGDEVPDEDDDRDSPDAKERNFTPGNNAGIEALLTASALCKTQNTHESETVKKTLDDTQDNTETAGQFKDEVKEQSQEKCDNKEEENLHQTEAESAQDANEKEADNTQDDTCADQKSVVDNDEQLHKKL